MTLGKPLFPNGGSLRETLYRRIGSTEKTQTCLTADKIFYLVQLQVKFNILLWVRYTVSCSRVGNLKTILIGLDLMHTGIFRVFIWVSV